MGYNCYIASGKIKIASESADAFQKLREKYDFDVCKVNSREYTVDACERFSYHEEDFQELADICEEGTCLNFIGEDNIVWSLHLHHGVIEDRPGKIIFDEGELNKISVPLGDGYTLEASRNPDDDYKEIFVYLKKDSLVTQDLAIISERYGYDEEHGNVVPIHGIYDVKVYADPMDENYTDQFIFGRYEEDE